MAYVPIDKDSKPFLPYPKIGGSSPLKTLTSVPFVAQSPATTLAIYLSKYCETATHGKVVFQGIQQSLSHSGGMLRFKCTHCKDNWNVGAELFPTAETLPKELTDWVKTHRHVCDAFKAFKHAPSHAMCVCGWPWHEHAQAKPVFDIEIGLWKVPDPPQEAPAGMTASYPMYIYGGTGPKEMPSLYPGKVIPFGSQYGLTQMPAYQTPPKCVVCGKESQNKFVPLCPICLEGAKKSHAVATAPKEAGGRMFRNEEGQCESVTDTEKPTSQD